MTFYNTATNTFYRGGALKTADGTIFNPTEATLKAHGYETYTPPPPPPPQPMTHEEIEQARAAAYRERVDPITCEIQRLRDMGGSSEKIAEAEARREAAVAAIKEQHPYPEDEVSTVDSSRL